MKIYEQVKLFTGDDAGKVEKQYNTWVKELAEWRKGIPILGNRELKIKDRKFVIRNYEGAETFALSIFYEHAELTASEMHGGILSEGDKHGFSVVKSKYRHHKKG